MLCLVFVLICYVQMVHILPTQVYYVASNYDKNNHMEHQKCFSSICPCKRNEWTWCFHEAEAGDISIVGCQALICTIFGSNVLIKRLVFFLNGPFGRQRTLNSQPELPGMHLRSWSCKATTSRNEANLQLPRLLVAQNQPAGVAFWGWER